MTVKVSTLPYTCARCLRSRTRPLKSSYPPFAAPLSTTSRTPQQQAVRNDASTEQQPPPGAQNKSSAKAVEDGEVGAMTRRLQDLSEESLASSGRRARKAVEEAGFNEELKEQLLNRLADANFRAENPAAFAQAGLSSAAGKGTRDMAAAEPWTGVESVEDASLRMLTDKYKPLRGTGAPRIPTPKGMPIQIKTGSKPAQVTGARLANARDKSSMYTYLKDESLNDEEKRKFRAELKARFQPGARGGAMTLRGLESLANERIEDAIARGQFKNLPRGKKLDRDYNMSSPFIDTTSYFLNKIIKKQDIVPPWIEKQQEVVSTATKFRARLRSDWRRHAARTISSQGGSVESQIRKAEQYAAAEAVVNPPPQKKVEKIDTVDQEGHVSEITLSGVLKVGTQTSNEAPTETITITEGPPAPALAPDSAGTPPLQPSVTNADSSASTASTPPESSTTESAPTNPYINAGAVFPFRDPIWEAAEHSYHTLCIKNLNDLTRSYNLMAPNLAKKPYFAIDRELRACYAEVAPQLAGEIYNRSVAPKVKIEVIQHKEGGVLERFSREERVRVYDEAGAKAYGFKQFWKDLWGVKA